MNALSIPSKTNLNSSPFPITFRPFPSYSAVPTHRSHFTVTFPPMRSQNSLDITIKPLEPYIRSITLPLDDTICPGYILCYTSTGHLSRVCGLRQYVCMGLNTQTFTASFLFILVSQFTFFNISLLTNFGITCRGSDCSLSDPSSKKTSSSFRSVSNSLSCRDIAGCFLALGSFLVS